jgi:hypothetical protein
MAGYWVLLRAYLCLRRAFLARSASRTACDLLVLSEACSLVDSSSAATQRSRQLGRQYSHSYIDRASVSIPRAGWSSFRCVPRGNKHIVRY